MSHHKNTRSTTDKRVCVYNLSNNMIMRVAREFAIAAVDSGQFRFTTKAALAKFMKRDLQLSKNEKFLKRAAAGLSKYGTRGSNRDTNPVNINSFKVLGGRVYDVINGWGEQYSNNYGGGQVLVKTF